MNDAILKRGNERPAGRMLPFLQGLLVGLCAIFWMQASWEDHLVKSIVERATENAQTDEERVCAIMHVAHTLMDSRRKLYLPHTETLRNRWIRSVDAHLQDAGQMCGSAYRVLARMLQMDGRDVRVGQMLGASGIWGEHIVVLTPVNGRWVVLDSFYDLAFRGQDGRLLTFEEIRENWEGLRAQLPEDYNTSYNYRDMRWTNWGPLPADWLGSWSRDLSIRAYFLNTWRVWAILSTTLLVAIVAVDLGARRRRGMRGPSV